MHGDGALVLTALMQHEVSRRPLVAVVGPCDGRSNAKGVRPLVLRLAGRLCMRDILN